MKTLKLLLLLPFAVMLLSQHIAANEYAYQGKVEGMVCAFCAYNVSKKISRIAGVNASSVDVDLNLGQVYFLSNAIINTSQLDKVFSDSGFSLASLTQVKKISSTTQPMSHKPVVTLRFSMTQFNQHQHQQMLDAIGELAAAKDSLLIISAPQDSEIKLLKPIIAGRQRTIKVEFIATNDQSVKIKLFRTAVDDQQ